MKDLRHRLLAAAAACAVFTGCSRVVPQMSTLPVRQETTSPSTQPTTTVTVTDTFDTPQTTLTSEETTTTQTTASSAAQTTTTAATAPPVQTAAPLVQTTTAATTTATPVTTTVTTVPAAPKTPEEQLLQQMTLRQKVSQMFIVRPEQIDSVTAAGGDTLEILSDYPAGGVVFFENNIQTPPQTKAMIDSLQFYSAESCGVGMLMAVDEEGGSVSRTANTFGTSSFSDMSVYGNYASTTDAYRIGSSIGTDLDDNGFNVDLAPVADVAVNNMNILGSRIFSSDSDVVASMVSSLVNGLQDTGVSSTLKHFPGLGACCDDAYAYEYTWIDRTVDELRSCEFKAFRSGIDAGADLVMVGHQIVTGFGDNTPSDLSYTAVTTYLRGELGFSGVAVTDAHQMSCITDNYSSGEASKLAVKAGIDIILLPEDFQASVDAVCAAVSSGEISEERINESVLRILALKNKHSLIE